MSQQVSSALLRTCSRQQLSANVARSAVVAAGQQRSVSNAGAKFDSPFATADSSTLKIPNFKKYTSKTSPTTNKVFSYFVAGTMGLGSAVGAKATVQGRSIIRITLLYSCWRTRHVVLGGEKCRKQSNGGFMADRDGL